MGQTRKVKAGIAQRESSLFVGEYGHIFYDNDNTRGLRFSDGVTPGGLPLNLPTASATVFGGIKLGPGITTNEDDQIIIDSTGLDFSFGDLAGTVGTYTDETDYAILQTINTNEDMVLASNGAGGIHVVGEFRVHATNGSLTETLENVPAFEIKADGQVKILVPVIDSQEGAVSIVGSSTGEFISPVNTGVMLHITGQYSTPAIPSRIYNDAQNSFAAFVARRFNGTVTSPTAVLADEEIMRISGTAHDGTTIPGAGNTRIVYKALGNQTLTNHGGAIELWTTPLNTTTLAKVITVDSTGITLESGKVLTGNVTGTATTATSAAVAYSTVAVHTAGTGLTGSTFNGSTAQTWTLNTATLMALSVSAQSATTAGTVTTAAQPAITSVGTLTNLSIATGGTITTPRIVINDGGIRTVSGGTTLTIDFATDSIILWTSPTGTAVITLSNYTAGAQVKLIIAVTTPRDITFGIASAALSSTGLDNWNGVGGGSIDITNTAVHLEYTCFTALAAGCYVKVTAN